MVAAIVVAVAFSLAVVASIAIMYYVAYRGSKVSDFFDESVKSSYELPIPEAEILEYYQMKEKLHLLYSPEAAADADEVDASMSLWVAKVPQPERMELQKALVRRLVASLDNLEQVQSDKPGTWKLWREKLVTERYWNSLLETEKLVTEEIDGCVAEADLIEPGWRQHIFRQSIECWRMKKQQVVVKKEQKKALLDEKKRKASEERQQELEKRKIVEEKERQEKLAAKMMEKLLREEEQELASSKKVAKAAAKTKAAGKKK